MFPVCIRIGESDALPFMTTGASPAATIAPIPTTTATWRTSRRFARTKTISARTTTPTSNSELIHQGHHQSRATTGSMILCGVLNVLPQSFVVG